MLRGIETTWLWTGEPSQAPIARGALLVDEAGRIAKVGEASELRRAHPEARWERHEGIAFPGLVNARVSLELSALRGRIAGGRGYVPWLRELTAAREERQPETDVRAIDAAIDELVRAGTAAIGEVTSSGASIERLRNVPLIARVFHEIAGLRRETATVVRAMAEQHYEEVELPANVALALAPHSVVGLYPPALAALFSDGGPLPLPLASSPAERAFLADGGGPLGAWMKERGADPADWEPPGVGAVEHAAALGIVGPSLVATHLTDARDEELALLGRAGARAILCPRSSLHVEVKMPPLGALLACGIHPALGTDSLAAAPSLDVLEEALALHRRFPTVDAGELCAMATSYGAQVLGLEDRVGRIAPGLSPGVLLFRGGPDLDDPLAHVLSQAGRARRILVRPGGAL